jgi:spoIIIJ-associated protein
MEENTTSTDSARPDLNESLEEAIQYAKKYTEDIISFFGLNTDVYATSNDHEVIELHVPSTRLNGFLIGQRGDTMHSLQYILGTALRNQNFKYSRVVLDIADYKKQRAQRLAETAQDWVKAAKEGTEDYHVKPMGAADRRVVHQLASEHGLETESVGDGRDRHVVIKAGSKEVETPAAE